MRNSHKQDSQFKLIGSSIPRKEDDRLLKGGGKFTDDVQIPHQLEMAVGRSPFPHAIIESVEVNAALELDGVEPTAHPLPLTNVFRSDQIDSTLDRDEVLAAAPAAEDGQFRVPPVLGET